jgi:hypothetical protein
MILSQSLQHACMDLIFLHVKRDVTQCCCWQLVQASHMHMCRTYPSALCCHAGPNGGVAKAIAEVMRPAALAAYQEALASVFTSSAEARRRAKDSALRALEEAFALLQLYERGCELVQVSEVWLWLFGQWMGGGRAASVDAVHTLEEVFALLQLFERGCQLVQVGEVCLDPFSAVDGWYLSCCV